MYPVPRSTKEEPVFLYWLIDVLSKASRNEPLTAKELTVVHSFDSVLAFIVTSALGAAITVLTNVFSGQTVFSWQTLGMALGLALCQAVGMRFVAASRAPASADLVVKDAPTPTPPMLG